MQPFQNELGIGFRSDKALIFFGGIHASLAKIQQAFPDLKFLRVKQTHSDIVIQAQEPALEADAQWTAAKNTGLLISTADCIPLMIYCSLTHRSAAVHAGWKGVQNQISAKMVNLLLQSGSTLESLQFFAGPHIMQNSFEIDADVFEQLQKAHPTLDPKNYSKGSVSKHYVDLKFLVEKQVGKSVTSVGIDTKTNENFFSYRRGKHGNERNLSFIAVL